LRAGAIGTTKRTGTLVLHGDVEYAKAAGIVAAA
jgi:hypothetical protein